MKRLLFFFYLHSFLATNPHSYVGFLDHRHVVRPVACHETYFDGAQGPGRVEAFRAWLQAFPQEFSFDAACFTPPLPGLSTGATTASTRAIVRYKDVVAPNVSETPHVTSSYNPAQLPALRRRDINRYELGPMATTAGIGGWTFESPTMVFLSLTKSSSAIGNSHCHHPLHQP